MEDQYIKLGLKVQGREDVDTLRQAHRVLKQEVYDLADTYEVLTSDLQTATKAMGSLEQEALRLKAAEDSAAASAVKLDAATATFTTSTKAAGREAANFNRSLLLLGQGVQDFQAAGLMGISNNLDQMVLALGGPAGLAALTVAVGAGFLALKGPIGEFYQVFVDAMRGAGESVPLDKLASLEKQIKANQDALDKYRESQRLTTDEVARYNGLVQEQARLERERDKAREDAETRKKAGTIRPKEEEEADKRRAEILRTQYATPDSRRALTDAAREGLPDDEIRRLSEKARAVRQDVQRRLDTETFLGGAEEPLLRSVEAMDRQVVEAIKRRAEKAEQLVADALVKGDKGAADQLRTALANAAAKGDPANLNANPNAGAAAVEANRLDNLERRVAESSPEAIAAKKARAKAEEERLKAEAKARNDAAKKRADDENRSIASEFDRQVAEVDAEVKAGAEAKKRKEGDERGRKAAEKKIADEKERDRKLLEKGLGDDFLAQAEAARIGIETDQTVGPNQRLKNRTAFNERLNEEARRRLAANGVPEEDARRAGGFAAGFVQDDIQRQLDMLRAQTGQKGGASVVGLLTQLQDIVGSVSQRQQATARQLSALEQRNRELERMQGPAGWGPQRRVQ